MKSQSLAVIACLLFGSHLHAAVVLAWNTNNNLGTETTEPSVVNQFASAAPLTLGAGVTATAASNRFGGNNWFDAGDTSALPGTTLAESIAGNDFIQFVVTPTQTIQLTSFDFRWDRSVTGPSGVALRSSADNFAANIGPVVSLPGTGTAQISILNSIPLTLQISSATTFRLYGFGATNAAGTGGFATDVFNSFSPNVVLNGLAVVPEPSSLALVGLTCAGGLWRCRRKFFCAADRRQA